MLFTEPLYLAVFFPIVFAAWLLTTRIRQARIWFLLAVSLLFYTWGEPRFIPVVIASALLDYLLGGPISRGSRLGLTVAILANLAILVFYKYLDFLFANIAGLLTLELTLPHIALPIGVSFVVFEKITYLVDLHRGISPAASGFGRYLTYVFFYPKLLAGPIIKYHEIEAQFRASPDPDLRMVTDGFHRFMIGLIKKVLIADVVAKGADNFFALSSAEMGFWETWAGILLFTLQIYFDFSAYSDMAIGIALMFGYRLRENFNEPYISCSITEFWHRWHISLSTWIREYLYIPLGGNRVGKARNLLNLWLCFLASGIWHGAAWNYVFWGIYHGSFLVAEKFFLLKHLDRMPRLAANGIALLIVVVGWAIFRAQSLEQIGGLFAAMVQPWRDGAGLYLANDVQLAAAAGAVICAAPRLPRPAALQRALVRTVLGLSVQPAIFLLFIFALSKAIADPFRPFLYFRF